ncbi:hypothetical protein NMK43_08495 [Bacillus licheniformis]|uniref:hypothetical protein n=1 Tax=Bacillus licheniformis TaxID=1402 RepID=UPI0020C8FC62|nr:hypothetical protein [Bacillus licheniformis]MCP8973133.1 hypothetical protein [Bacillus licheniformis]
MSEIKKPVITKEQANSIENIRREGVLNDEDILRNHGKFTYTDACLNDLAFMTLAAALIDEYEVDKTPEEKIREYYEEAQRRCKARREIGDIEGLRYNAGRGYGVVDTLDILGMKIEGVNAK